MVIFRIALNTYLLCIHVYHIFVCDDYVVACGTV